MENQATKRPFRLFNARGACPPNYCQNEASLGARCMGFCDKSGADQAAKMKGEAPYRDTASEP